MSDPSTPQRRCDPLYWRLELVAGEREGFLLCLMCVEQHVHFVMYTPLLAEAHGMARAWERETLPQGYPPLAIEEMWRAPDSADAPT